MAQYFLQPLGAGDRHNLHSGLNSLGRNPTNDVRLLEPSVSSFHCEIDVTPDRVVVRDLQSTNGTRLNNLPVTEAQIGLGDELMLGQLRLQLDCETPVCRLSAPPPPSPAESAPAASRNYQCTVCGRVWEARRLKTLTVGRDSAELRFCPTCSGRCQLADPAGLSAVPAAGGTLLNRLSQTIRIGTWPGVGRRQSVAPRGDAVR